MEITLHHKIIDFIRGDRPEDEAVDLPWAYAISTPEAARLPKKSFLCFLRFLIGERYWDDNDNLPPYERVAFFNMPGAAECRRTMIMLRKHLGEVHAPAIITFDYTTEVAQ